MEYPKIGIPYYHYKGGVYEVITLAKHTETNEDMVVYKSQLYGTVFVRPLSMWFEDVEVDVRVADFSKMEYAKTKGKVPRFTDDPKVYEIIFKNNS